MQKVFPRKSASVLAAILITSFTAPANALRDPSYVVLEAWSSITAKERVGPVQDTFGHRNRYSGSGESAGMGAVGGSAYSAGETNKIRHGALWIDAEQAALQVSGGAEQQQAMVFKAQAHRKMGEVNHPDVSVSSAGRTTTVRVSEATVARGGVHSMMAEAEVPQGGTLLVEVPQQLGTGYTWEVRRRPGRELQIEGRTDVASRQALPGRVDLRVFRFSAKRKGETSLSLISEGPAGQPPGSRLNLTVQVR